MYIEPSKTDNSVYQLFIAVYNSTQKKFPRQPQFEFHLYKNLLGKHLQKIFLLQ